MTEQKTMARPDPVLQSAYDRYTAANAAHTIVCANPKATETERFDAAMAVHTAYHEFLSTNPRDGAEKAAANLTLVDRLGQMDDAIYRAHSMLLAVDAAEFIVRLPAETEFRDQHSAGVALVHEAQDILWSALEAGRKQAARQ